jgi:hypothetical protein
MALDRAIIFTGDRDWRVGTPMRQVLETIAIDYTPSRVLIIHGGAKGVDMLTDAHAQALGFAVARLDANWNKYLKAAGPIRNGWMLDLVMLMPNAEVMAFHNDLKHSRGTQDMVKRAHKAQIPWVNYDDQLRLPFTSEKTPLPWDK